jgi:hypothetical protein
MGEGEEDEHPRDLLARCPHVLIQPCQQVHERFLGKLAIAQMDVSKL